MDYLDKALDWLLEEEGGWSNHPADRGGATMYGVTQATYNSFRKKMSRPLQSVAKISKEEAKELYLKEYWEAASCHKLPWPISYLVFDAAVNSGVKRAVDWLQTGLHTQRDGKVGPKTIQTAEKALSEGNTAALLGIVDARTVFLARLVQSKPSQAAFLLGWWRRTQRLLVRALLEVYED